MKTSRLFPTGAGLAAVTLLLSAPGLGAPAGAAPADQELQPRPDARVPVAARVLEPTFDAARLKLMARSSGRSVAAQEALLERQFDANNTLARLQRSHAFDGAFLTPAGGLVVNAAPGSAAARAATAAGATVRDAAYGESELERLQRMVAAADPSGVSTVEVDLRADRVVVGRSGVLSPEVRALVADEPAVVVEQTQPYTVQRTVLGGDAVYAQSGGRCSAGFPARSGSGTRYMIWAGHCNEGGGSFTSGGTRIGVSAASAFVSYDGRPDRDIGALRMDAEDSVSTTGNTYGSGRTVNAPNGAAKPAVGTQLCKSGSTTGVTCGAIQSYDNTVNYTDAQGRQVAQVSGLMQTTVCTQAGDSGGAYSAGGFAVGLTSGGPAVQRCTYNGGFQSGKSSLVQPVTDALAYYGLSYN